MFNLDIWDHNAEYLVCDDIPFEYFGGGRKALWGAQKELVLTDRYRRKMSVKWNKPMIYLSNPGEDFRYAKNSKGWPILNGDEIEWYMANCQMVTVTEKMWRDRLD